MTIYATLEDLREIIKFLDADHIQDQKFKLVYSSDEKGYQIDVFYETQTSLSVCEHYKTIIKKRYT